MVERQGWGDLTEGLGAPLIKVLVARRGQPTIIRMASGEELFVYDGSGWGRDYGDMWEHVTARITPPDAAPRDYDHHFFYMSEVEALLDPETGAVLISQTPSPGQT